MCVAPLLVKGVSLFVRVELCCSDSMVAFPPTGTPLKSPSFAKKVSQGALQPCPAASGTKSWSP